MEEMTIEIKRSSEFKKNAKKVGEHINSLNLQADDHNKLIDLIIEQVQEAEATAFIQGFKTGVDMERGRIE